MDNVPERDANKYTAAAAAQAAKFLIDCPNKKPNDCPIEDFQLPIFNFQPTSPGSWVPSAKSALALSLLVSTRFGWAQPVPRPDHVVVVMMENRRYDEIIGNTNDAPWINSLRPIAANFTDSRGIQHPSQPNYLHFYSGSNQGVNDNNRPTPPSPPFRPLSTPNLGAQLLQAGFRFIDYGEDMPYPGFDGDSFSGPNGTYFRCENVAANWMTDATLRPANNVPLLVLQPLTNLPPDYAQLPDVSFWHPVEEHDMHAGFYSTSSETIRVGDAWLRRNLSNYVAWAMTHQSLFVLTWDEDDYSQPSNRIPTLFVGPMVRPASYSYPINHHSVLRTLEDMYGLPYAGNASTSAPIVDIWRSTLSDRLVVYLDFDTNLAAQASTSHNGTLFTGTPRYTNGILRGAASFRNPAAPGAPNDWAVSLGNLESVFADEFSFSLWIRTTNTDNAALFGNKDWSLPNSPGWAVSILDGANVQWATAGGAPREVDLQPPLPDGTWHLVSVTFNRAANRVITYLDGRSRRTNSLA